MTWHASLSQLVFLKPLYVRVADSIVGQWFLLEGCGLPNERQGSRFTWVLLTSLLRSIVFLHLRGVQQTEIRAGMTTLIAVNASILSDSGGTCVCPTSDGCVNDTTYQAVACINEMKRDLITTTAAISSLSLFLMGLLANLPVGLAPGLGVNAYFTYSVVGFHGTGMISYRQALAAVFMEGWFFLFLSLLGLRQWLVRIMPQSLVLAVGAGIGLFIAYVSGYIQKSALVLKAVAMKRFVGLCIFTGGLFTVFLMMYCVCGAILIGIFLTAIISWPRSMAVTYFPYTATGDEKFNFFKQVLTFRKLEKIGNALDRSSTYYFPHIKERSCLIQLGNPHPLV
ncbi:purine transporter [Amanita muscaria]